MHYRVLLAGAIVLSACGQKTFSSPVIARTSAAPEDTYGCVRKQLGELGYRQNSNDADEHRVTATKIDYKSRRADVQFRRMLDRLEVDVSAEADGQTSINAVGRTFAEYTTQRGPTEEEEKASELVRSDMRTLLERCGS